VICTECQGDIVGSAILAGGERALCSACYLKAADAAGMSGGFASTEDPEPKTLCVACKREIVDDGVLVAHDSHRLSKGLPGHYMHEACLHKQVVVPSPPKDLVRAPVCPDAPLDDVRTPPAFYRAECSFIGGPKHGVVHEVQWPGEKPQVTIRCLWGDEKRVLIYEALRSGEGHHIALFQSFGPIYTGPRAQGSAT
jgi:hypothetical protein